MGDKRGLVFTRDQINVLLGELWTLLTQQTLLTELRKLAPNEQAITECIEKNEKQILAKYHKDTTVAMKDLARVSTVYKEDRELQQKLALVASREEAITNEALGKVPPKTDLAETIDIAVENLHALTRQNMAQLHEKISAKAIQLKDLTPQQQAQYMAYLNSLKQQPPATSAVPATSSSTSLPPASKSSSSLPPASASVGTKSVATPPPQVTSSSSSSASTTPSTPKIPGKIISTATPKQTNPYLITSTQILFPKIPQKTPTISQTSNSATLSQTGGQATTAAAAPTSTAASAPQKTTLTSSASGSSLKSTASPPSSLPTATTVPAQKSSNSSEKNPQSTTETEAVPAPQLTPAEAAASEPDPASLAEEAAQQGAVQGAATATSPAKKGWMSYLWGSK